MKALGTIVALAIFLCLFALAARAQDNSPDNAIGFIGMSGDPNGGTASAAADLGFAKLVGTGTYIGAVAHLTRKSDIPKFQLATQIQFHLAQRMPITFGKVSAYWTAEVGPEFANGLSGQPATQDLKVGYAVGSGPMLCIPIGKHLSIMPHAEATGGSLQDLTWRGGILFGFGSSK